MQRKTRRVLGTLGMVLGTTSFVLGLTVSPSAANQATCPEGSGWTKVDNGSSGDVLAGDAELLWTAGDDGLLTYSIPAGGQVDICIKSGEDVSFVTNPNLVDSNPDSKVGTFLAVTGAGTIDPSKGISHVSYRYTPPPTSTSSSSSSTSSTSSSSTSTSSSSSSTSSSSTSSSSTSTSSTSTSTSSTSTSSTSTSTTAPSTTTTVLSTTLTTPTTIATTSTTEAPSTTTTEDVGVLPSVTEQTTTTVAPSTTLATRVQGNVLARTGSEHRGLMLAAGLLLVVGGTVLYGSTRFTSA